MLNIFVYLSVVFFAIFFFIWERNSFLNLFIKTFLGGMMVFGIIVAAELSGYIVKVN